MLLVYVGVDEHCHPACTKVHARFRHALLASLVARLHSQVW